VGKFKDEFVGLATAAAGLYVAYLTGGLSASSFTGQAAFATYASAAATAYGVSSSRRASRLARANYNSSLQDREITTTSSVASRRIPYGTAMAGGNLTFIRPSGEFNKYLHLVITLSDACTSIDDVLFDNESIGGLDEFGFVQKGSRFWKRELKHKSIEVTGPGRGGEVELLDPIRYQRVESVSTSYVVHGEADTPVVEHFIRNTDYINTDRGIIFVNDRAKGKKLVITYVYDDGKPLVRIFKYTGREEGDNLRDVTLEQDFPGVWTSSQKGYGVARIHIRIEFDQDIFGSTGLPGIAAKLKGRYVLDFRNSNYVSTDNAALVISDFLMHDYGYSVNRADIDEINFSAEANLSQQPILENGVNNGQNRFTINGMVYADEAPSASLEQLLTSNLGGLIWSGGKWTLKSSQYMAPEMSLDQNDLAEGSITMSSRMERVDLVNTVRGTFIDELIGFRSNSYPEYKALAYVAEDNGRTFRKPLNFPFVKSALVAQRLAKLHVAKSRQAVRGNFPFGLKALRLRPFDTFRFTLPYAGFDEKVFRVNSVRFSYEEMAVYVDAQEDAPEIYSEFFDDLKTPDPAPNTKLPDPRFVPAITRFEVNSNASSYTVLDDGTVAAHVECSWDAITSSTILLGGYIEIWWKYSSETTYRREKVSADTVEYLIRPVVPGQLINVYAIAYSGVGTKSDQVDVTHSVSSDIPSNQSGNLFTGNRLQNASFADNAIGWRIFSAGSSPANKLVRPQGDPVAESLPAPVTLRQDTPTDEATFFIHNRKVRLEPGVRYCVQFKSANRYSTGYMQIDPFDKEGNRLEIFRTDKLLGNLSDPVDGSTPRTMHGFFTAPPNTFDALVSLVKGGIGGPGAGFSQIDFAQPMLSIADKTQKLAPAWQDGPPLVTYREIIPINSSDTIHANFVNKVLSKTINLTVGQRVTLTTTINGSITTSSAAIGAINVTVKLGAGSNEQKIRFDALYDGAPIANTRRTGSETNIQDLIANATGETLLEVFVYASGAAAASNISSSSILIEIT